MNEKHAVVREAGKAVVITEEYDPMLKRWVIRRSSFTDIRNFYMARKVQAADGHLQGLGTYWLDHPQRRQFEGVVFAPLQDVPGYYNLWRGFAVTPRPGNWSLMQAHIRDIVCRSDDALDRYVLAWMAFGVQHPDRLPEVALVLRGGQGVGKGIVGREYGGLFGQHFVHVTHARHLTGNFNAHLHDAVVVFGDEAFGVGDKEAAAVLKTLITEPTILIERKGHDVIAVRNMTHLILASNQEWVIPAGLDERRFGVFDVSNAHQEDHAYFQAIIAQMEHGGREAMLYDLDRLDISQVNLRHAPTTAALQEQKLYSMSPQHKWWFDLLMDRRLLPTHHVWRTNVQRDELHQAYVNGPGRGRMGQRATQTELGMFLKKVLPPGYPRRPQRVRRRIWVLPNLAECRAHFEQLMKTTYTWP